MLLFIGMLHNAVAVALAGLALLPTTCAVPTSGVVPPEQQSVNAAVKTSGGSGAKIEDDIILAKAWYPGWLGEKFPPSEISWSKYNSMTFAFAITTPNPSVIALDDVSKKTLPQMVATARAQGVSPSLSIGGWTGSMYFSTAVATTENRRAFIKAVIGLATQYELDGIDFDWEYPNKKGIGCNVASPEDSVNFLLFLRELREDPVGKNLTISVAVGLAPFAGPDGNPMTDVSEFAKVLNHIAIMGYDIWGAWSTGVGPNAPLDDSCSPASAGSATTAVKAWTAAGFPPNQIALGVATYGRSFYVSATNALDNTHTISAFPQFDKAQQPRGDSWDTGDGTTVDQCGNPENASGIFNFWGLVEQGYLTSNGTAAAGIDYRFDGCSQTPFVYNPQKQTMISYDDALSFAAKGQFIKDRGLKGFAVWNSAGDYQDILLTSIWKAISEECNS
ncbi:hypothetical protein HGRIS_001156 [Hohenbuehelia grisea]|uniref:GH18 domain-containing protein n=1 Tax=Hohenbuehelia grisea TaxID=104357 RepID=A0ABR3JPG6_9AGAR